MEHSSAQHAPRMRSVILVSLLVGALAGALVNWRVLSSILGLLPAERVRAPDVIREVTIEESARTDAALRAQASMVRIVAQQGSEAPDRSALSVTSGVALTDDGLFLVLARANTPAAIAAVTRDGYVLPLTVLGTDPWSGFVFARASLDGIPSGALTPAPLIDTTAQLGQHVLAARMDDTLVVEAALVAALPSSAVADAILLDPLRFTPIPSAPTLYFDLTGGLVAISADAQTTVGAASIQTLLRTFQQRAILARPAFGLTAEDLLPGDGVAQAPLGSARIVTVTDGGPAAAALLIPGDIVTAVNGRTLTTEYHLRDALIRQIPGRALDLTVLREGITLTLTLTPGDA